MKFPPLFLIFFFLVSSSLSQQPYEVNNAQLKCDTNGVSTLGYTCNSVPTCKSFFVFRSETQYQSPSQISSLLNSTPSSITQLNQIPSPNQNLPINDLVIVPSSCSCVNKTHYQHNARYKIKITGETYLTIANDTYQGLSTCQALIAQNRYGERNLVVGMDILVPLRCACPTERQAKNGTKYLVTYLITWGDDVPTISERFNAIFGEVLDANGLKYNEVIYPFTTLLIPVKSEPTKDQVLSPPPPAASPVPPVAPAGDSGGSSKKWVFVGVGIGVGFVVVCGVLGWYFFCFRRARRKPDEMPVAEARKVEDSSNEYGALSGKTSSAPFVSSEIRGFIESLVVYKFADLEKATGFFGEEYRIKGSVYRAVINGDDAAVKRLKGDVSNEIKILKQINHSNVVRLSGFCVHEGNTYLVYEFVEKGSLADWLHHGKDLSDGVLSWKHRIRISYDVADGLNYLHNYTNPPYIHKNLKSSNVLLDSEFRGKLANFGLARPVDEYEEIQLTVHVMGTQGYMAPEYLEHGLITPKLDVFAFGVILLELLSGKEATFAMDGEEKGEVMLWALIENVMSGEDVRTKLKDFIDPCLGNEYPFDLAFAMAELAMRCLAEEPGSRPEMADVLMSLSAIYNSTLDWDPSYVGNSGSMVHGRNLRD